MLYIQSVRPPAHLRETERVHLWTLIDRFFLTRILSPAAPGISLGSH